MKKTFVILILLLAAVDGYSQIGFGIGGGGFGMGMRVPLNSNSGARRSRSIENQVQKMKSDLDLNKNQVIKMRSLLVERDRRRQGSDPMTPQEYNQRLQQILTPEQFNKLAELRKQKGSQKQQQNTSPKNGDNKQTPPQKEEDWDDVYN